ncbi:dihydrofolate reductase family protein [Roseisolibacter sp. H3M3-2]|uniref:dihydrofolate reductase family protein n=1 Tax=Roseisolibacter sp. H3M3-2 TaxID=3031323 RepID=UPI0023DC5DCF|nr:dihydrofolate reductase family protein [Roseisolibacter sp. H3M3-2]
MGRVVLDMAVSLDGYASGPDGGDAGLHDWYFDPAPADVAVIDELLGEIGAMVLGRGMLGAEPAGFDTPYRVPHFVMTRTARPTIDRGGVPFAFVTGGVEAVVGAARRAAGDRVVCVAGGPTTARAAMAAGLVDVLDLHVVSRVLGGGLRLYDGWPAVALERERVVESAGVTHLRYRVVR